MEVAEFDPLSSGLAPVGGDAVKLFADCAQVRRKAGSFLLLLDYVFVSVVVQDGRVRLCRAGWRILPPPA